MAEDYSNRIGKRHISLTQHERPTQEGIADLMRRHDEHRKRTRPAPKVPFDKVLGQTASAAADPSDPKRQPSHDPGSQQQGSAPDADAPNDADGAEGSSGPKPAQTKVDPRPKTLATSNRRFIKA